MYEKYLVVLGIGVKFLCMVFVLGDFRYWCDGMFIIFVIVNRKLWFYLKGLFLVELFDMRRIMVIIIFLRIFYYNLRFNDSNGIYKGFWVVCSGIIVFVFLLK